MRIFFSMKKYNFSGPFLAILFVGFGCRRGLFFIDGDSPESSVASAGQLTGPRCLATLVSPPQVPLHDSVWHREGIRGLRGRNGVDRASGRPDGGPIASSFISLDLLSVDLVASPLLICTSSSVFDSIVVRSRSSRVLRQSSPS